MDNIHNLSCIDIDSLALGVMMACRMYEPKQDLVRATKVKEWLADHHLDYAAFRRLVKAGLVKAHKMGDGVNYPLCYSKCEMHYAFSLQRRGMEKGLMNLKKEEP